MSTRQTSRRMLVAPAYLIVIKMKPFFKQWLV
jgi:hypothetical protein